MMQKPAEGAPDADATEPSGGSEKIFRRVIDSPEWIAAGAVIILSILVCVGVFARYVLKAPQSIIMDFSSALMVIVVFLPLGAAMLAGAHIRTDLLKTIVPERFVRIVDVWNLVLALLVGIFLSISFTMRFFEVFETGAQSSNSHFSVWIPTLAMPVGAIFFAASVLYALVRTLKDKRSYIVDTEETVL